MSKVFISYASHDIGLAEEAESELKKRGLEVWRDRSGLGAGEEWMHSIEREINTCDAVLLILTERSGAATYMNFEWAYALGHGIRVVPILFERSRVHPRLEILNYIDFTAATRDWEQVRREVHRPNPQPLNLFNERFPKRYMSDFTNATEMWLVGVSLWETVRDNRQQLKKNVANCQKICVLLSDPKRSVVEPAVRRKFGSGEEDITDKCREIERTIAFFRDLARHAANSQVQVRTTTYPLGYGVHRMRFHDKSSAVQEDVLYVKLYPYKAQAAQKEKPKFMLRMGLDSWFPSFSEELHSLWEDAIEVC